MADELHDHQWGHFHSGSRACFVLLSARQVSGTIIRPRAGQTEAQTGFRNFDESRSNLLGRVMNDLLNRAPSGRIRLSLLRPVLCLVLVGGSLSRARAPVASRPCLAPVPCLAPFRALALLLVSRSRGGRPLCLVFVARAVRGLGFALGAGPPLAPGLPCSVRAGALASVARPYLRSPAIWPPPPPPAPLPACSWAPSRGLPWLRGPASRVLLGVRAVGRGKNAPASVLGVRVRPLPGPGGRALRCPCSGPARPVPTSALI